MQPIAKGLFVVGTDTDVGKTFVAALVARKLVEQGQSVGVYKPVASGCQPGTQDWDSRDAVQLWQAAGKPLSLDQVTPQHFAAPLAPPHAAALAGQQVDRDLLRRGVQPWTDFDFLLVEGAGGLLSPISEDDTVLDLAWEFHLPLLIVVANRLGCINQTLLTVRVAQSEKIPVAGIVLNHCRATSDASAQLNAEAIASRVDVPLLEHLDYGATKLRSNPEEWIRRAQPT